MDARDSLALEIYDVSHLTGDFLLRSGLRSNEYFDKYRFESEPALLQKIAKHLVKLVPPDIDYLAGLELGGIPIATALSFETGIPAVFVRKKAKEYGTCQFAEGKAIAHKKLVIIEDVITTGGQVVQSAKDLRSSGALVNSVICVIYRADGPAKALVENKLDCHSLFTMDEIKEVVTRRG